MRNQRLITGAKFLVALSLLVYLLQDANLGDILETIRNTHIASLVFAFSLYAIGYLITGFRLHLLISAYGKKIPVRFLIQSFIIATFFNNFLPSTVGGDLSRSYDLWRYFGDKSRAVASILIDRFLGLFALLLFIIFSTLFAKEFAFPERTVYLWVSGATFLATLIIYLIFFTPQWLPGLTSHYSVPTKHPLLGKARNFLNALYSFRGKRKILVYALCLSILLQVNVITQYYIVARSLSIDIPLLAFFTIIPLAIFVMMVPISINAIGVREGVFVFFFSFYNVSNSTAIAYAWVMYGFVLMQGLLGAIVFVLRQRLDKQLESR